MRSRPIGILAGGAMAAYTVDYRPIWRHGAAPLKAEKTTTCSPSPRKASRLDPTWISHGRLSITGGPADSALPGRHGSGRGCRSSSSLRCGDRSPVPYSSVRNKTSGKSRAFGPISSVPARTPAVPGKKSGMVIQVDAGLGREIGPPPGSAVVRGPEAAVPRYFSGILSRSGPH